MKAIASRLAELRASRRQTMRALAESTETQLGLPIPWRGRQADVRYLLLRLAEADDERRVAIRLTLDSLGWRQPEAARILGGRLGQVRSLLVGVPDEIHQLKPSPGEWSVGQVLEHLRLVEGRYLIQTEYAVERLSAPALPIRVPDDRLPPIPTEPVAAPTTEESLERLESAAASVDQRLSTLAESALTAPTVWSGWTVDVRFRLHRFRAHARQHAVQVAKTLRAVGWHPSEAQMILGQAEEARAALEGALLGLPDDLVEQTPVALHSVAALLDQALADEEGTRDIGAGLGERVRLPEGGY